MARFFISERPACSEGLVSADRSIWRNNSRGSRRGRSDTSLIVIVLVLLLVIDPLPAVRFDYDHEQEHEHENRPRVPG